MCDVVVIVFILYMDCYIYIIYTYMHTYCKSYTHNMHTHSATGNINFEQGKDSESSKISTASTTTLQHCAELLGIHTDSFTYALVEKKVQMGRGSIVSIALSVTQAEENKDTVAKTLYSNLFDWTIQKVRVF